MSSILNKSTIKKQRKQAFNKYQHEEQLPKMESCFSQIKEEDPNIDEEDEERNQTRNINDL